MIAELPPTALNEWLHDSTRAAPLILDVRESWEHALCSIAGARLVPMQEIPTRWSELPRDRDIVVLCHHGMRSLQVAQYLESVGLERLHNLNGGIAAWADEVDPSMAQY